MSHLFASKTRLPKVITSAGNAINLYETLAEQYGDNLVISKAVFSVIPVGKTHPVFGAMWTGNAIINDQDFIG